jgi:DNA-binding beta-propeller fold protein YncE
MQTRRFLSLILSLLAVTFVTSSARAAPAPNRQLWDRVFESGFATAEVLSPDGSTVYVTGCGGILGCSGKIQTVAYAVSTGHELWSITFTPAKSSGATAIAISPDGTKVFVTGSARYTYDEYGEYQTIAYDTSTGAQLWSARYAFDTRNYPCCIGVSADGTKVFVTGESQDLTFDFATVAYDAATGGQLWVTRYDGTGGEDNPAALRVSPDGGSVYVTGGSTGEDFYNDYATVAYDSATGTQLWVARFNNPIKIGDTPYGLAVSPDGARLFVTGCQGIIDQCANGDYLTIAYDAPTGTQLWIARYNGPVDDIDTAQAVVVSPDGSLVFVTGTSAQQSGNQVVTIAYDAATGTRVWLAHFSGVPGREASGCCLAVSADGSRLVVAGTTYVEYGQESFVTVAYDPATGSQLWTATFSGSGPYNFPAGVAVTRNGQVALVTGTVIGPDSEYDWGTVAYRA